MKKKSTLRSHVRGMNLVEILVGMALAMIAATIVVKAFSASEVFRRGIAGSSDAQQTGNINSFFLKRLSEESGSVINNPDGLWGCGLQAQAITPAGGMVPISPVAAAFPAPFNTIPTNPLRLAPAAALLGAQTSGDTLILMTGRSTDSSRDFLASFVQPNLDFQGGNTDPPVGIRAGDWVISYLDPTGVTAAVQPCFLMRVAANYAATPPLPTVLPGIGARQAAEPNRTIPLVVTPAMPPNESRRVLTRHLGSQPSFVALAVNSADNTLRMLNLLDATRTPQTLAEDVIAMRVIYGADANNNGIVDAGEWVQPQGTWAYGTILNGTVANAQRLQQILAMRVGFVVRGSRQSGAETSNRIIQLFPDLGTYPPITMPYGSAEAGYQYQVFDVTIPLRNVRNPS